MEKNQNQTKTPGFKPMDYIPYPCGEIYPSLDGVNRNIDSSDYCDLDTNIKRRRREGICELPPELLNITGCVATKGGDYES